MAESTIKNIIGTVYTDYANNRIRAMRTGNIVSLRINISETAYTGGWNTLATLGSIYRPETNTDFMILDNTATNKAGSPLQLRIQADGSVRIYSFGASNIAPIGTVTYIV